MLDKDTIQPAPNPNPQGKGLVPVLQDWSSVQPQMGAAKSAVDLLRDYCFSALVLAAKFRFQPRPGNHYFLYSGDCDWILSLVAPREWGKRAPGDFVATCHLDCDMTWRLEFAGLDRNSETFNRLRAFIGGFAETVARQEAPEQELPFYVADLPYHQRMLATGLSVSLRHSLRKMGPTALQRVARAALETAGPGLALEAGATES